MTGIKDLFASERGLVGLVLIASCTTLVGLGQMTVADWTAYTKWIFLIYVGGKTVTGAVGMMTGNGDKPEDKPAAVVAAGTIEDKPATAADEPVTHRTRSTTRAPK